MSVFKSVTFSVIGVLGFAAIFTSPKTEATDQKAILYERPAVEIPVVRPDPTDYEKYEAELESLDRHIVHANIMLSCNFQTGDWYSSTVALWEGQKTAPYMYRLAQPLAPEDRGRAQQEALQSAKATERMLTDGHLTQEGCDRLATMPFIQQMMRE